MALTNKLTNIADAIRGKTGTTGLLTLDEMVTEIEAIETGGGSAELPAEAFYITGTCQGKFANNGWNWFVETYGKKITTENITVGSEMFRGSSTLVKIPFDLNFNGVQYNQDYIFSGCYALESIGKISNMRPNSMEGFFSGCERLRYLPEFINFDGGRINTYAYSSTVNIFQNCKSLRSIPEDLLKQLYSGVVTSTYYSHFQNMFFGCHALDEIRGVVPLTGKMTSNLFSSTFTNCNRVKDIIFATQEDGTPYSVNWSNQTIDLSSNIGYSKFTGYANEKNSPTGWNQTKYNSGITIDKRVDNATTYEALKNDPDWFTGEVTFSRYNKISAINTINSLPDVTQGTGNVIKFNSIAGMSTDGGDVSALTEAEIAVAAAKGWTVTLV